MATIARAGIRITTVMLKAWRRNALGDRLAVVVFVLLYILVGVFAVLFARGYISSGSAFGILALIVVLQVTIAATLMSKEDLLEREAREERTKSLEQSLRENPEQPQLAWDLARDRLERYLDRNLGQIRSIYGLTVFVMLVGFAFIMFGLWRAFVDPRAIQVSVVGSASGVLVSMIGGSFLVIYRSILAQSKDYMTVLERINAVGMAVQVIASISEDSAELRHTTTATLANQLLSLYAAPTATPVHHPRA